MVDEELMIWCNLLSVKSNVTRLDMKLELYLVIMVLYFQKGHTLQKYLLYQYNSFKINSIFNT